MRDWLPYLVGGLVVLGIGWWLMRPTPTRPQARPLSPGSLSGMDQSPPADEPVSREPVPYQDQLAAMRLAAAKLGPWDGGDSPGAALSVQRLCEVRLHNDPARILEAERQVLAVCAHGAELTRCLEVAFESLAIVEKTKNIDTLYSRLGVARTMLTDAHRCAPLAFPQSHLQQLLAVVHEAASGNLAEIAIQRVQLRLQQATQAKTPATRIKRQTEAVQLAEEWCIRPEVLPDDRARIRAARMPPAP